MAYVVPEVYEKAIGDLGAILELERDHIGAPSARALTRMECAQYEEAVQDFGRLVELIPGGQPHLLRQGLRLRQPLLATELLSLLIDTKS